MAELKPCPFCHEDMDGYFKMLGAFCISNPFHRGEYFLNGGKLKPRKINYCPVCGRELNSGKDEARNGMMEWISVEDRLPEKCADVLMLFEHNMAVGFWHDCDEHIHFWCTYTDDEFYTDCDEEPIYWMPLPEPPKEETP